MDECKEKCMKCQGEGWLWWNELENYSGPANGTGSDDTKYSCDCRCHDIEREKEKVEQALLKEQLKENKLIYSACRTECRSCKWRNEDEEKGKYWWNGDYDERDNLMNAMQECKCKCHKLCVNCGEREATETWVGDGGVLAWSHGGGRPWCELCCKKAQLKYAEDAASRISNLKKEIFELERKV